MRLLLLLCLAAAPALAQETCALEGVAVLETAGKPIKGTVVAYVENLPGRAKARPKTDTYTIHQHNRQFEPKVLVIFKDDEVEFVNDDRDEHGVFSNSAPATFVWPYTRKGVTGRTPFNHLGPVRIQCDIHSTMRADVLVVANKFFTTADAQGHWRLDGLPRGPTYKVKFWEPNGAVLVNDVACTQDVMWVGEAHLEQGPAPALLRRNGEAYHPTWQ